MSPKDAFWFAYWLTVAEAAHFAAQGWEHNLHGKAFLTPARLDADKSAQPKTEIVGHVVNWGQCIGPHSAESYTIRHRRER